jgi:hypothetical protein
MEMSIRRLTTAVTLTGLVAFSGLSQIDFGVVAHASSGAAFTTFDVTQGGCLDGTNGVDCNNYAAKGDVYTNGGPASAGLADGSYFFAVVAPGSQHGGFVDGASGNLSSPNDAVTNRTFTVTDHVLGYGGTHAMGTDPQGDPVIQLAPYSDTPNSGGVYILAVCPTSAQSAADTHLCKFDAFRIPAQGSPQPPSAVDLLVSKTAVPAFTRTWSWDIHKRVDRTLVKQIGGSATFNYTVTVDQGAAIDSAWKVTGAVTVVNPNNADATGVSIESDVISAGGVADPGASCAPDSAGAISVPANSAVDIPYTCVYSAAPAGDDEVNSAVVEWNPTFSDGSQSPDGDNAGSPATAGITWSATTPHLVDDSVAVTDAVDGGAPVSLGTVTETGTGAVSPAATYQYAHTFAVPTFDCVTHNNTATFVTDTTGTRGSASAAVTLCGPVHSGALTMGFWQNKNGQAIITGGSSVNGVCSSGTWLRTYNPFLDLSSTATCSQTATYVYNVVKAASAAGASMNAMLKSQMLATALDVYFGGGPGGTKISTPDGPIGSISIDLTSIGGSENTSAAFGGATCMTVSALLSYENGVSNAGGTVWYGQVKATQGLAKDTFDGINNQIVFGC